jgi:16S rRNA (cytidine1402-2'-O)-methyltransferase
LRAGQAVALVCDAGTPNLSDPGFRLVRACRRAGLPVIPIPGPSAILAALCASGLPTNGFLFAGFLPPKTSARKNFLAKYHDCEYTIVLYESCHRIAKLTDDIVEVLGPARVLAVARELTKKFETFLVGPAAEVRTQLAGDNLRGEFTVVIAPADYEL